MNAEVELSFRTGFNRLLILRFMNNYDSVYLSQIARELLLDNSNVKGCLEGNSRYNKSLSLVNLNLVEIIHTNHKYYRITDYGKIILNEIIQKGNKI